MQGVALVLGGEESSEARWESEKEREEFILALCEIRERVEEMVEEALGEERIQLDTLRDVQIDVWGLMQTLVQVYQMTQRAGVAGVD